MTLSKAASKPLEYIYEGFLALNIAAALMWARSATTDFRLLQRAKNLFYPRFAYSDNYAAGYLAFILLTGVFACFLLLLLLVGKRWFLKPLGVQLAGIVTLLIVPGVWWYIGNIVGPFKIHAFWFPVEGAVIAISAFSYVHSSHSHPILVGAFLLLIGHFSLWTWITQQYFLGNHFGFIFPILGFLSTLSWGFYAAAMHKDSLRPAIANAENVEE